MSSEKRYDGYFKIGSNWLATRKRDFKSALAPGMYMLKFTENGEPILSEKDNNYDDLVHLPGTAYETVVDEIDKWLDVKTRGRYEDNGFLYKRSVLLHGAPGVGKTATVNRVANEVITKGGIVLFNVPPDQLNLVYEVVDEIEKNRLVMVIFEELDQLVENYEEALLHILDGEIQRENVIYVGTTNYLDKVPKRIMRPGRFSLVLEVDFPKADTRKYYLDIKLADSTGAVNADEVAEWVEKTEDFSIDELKETVLAVKCLDYSLDDAVGKIKQIKKDSKAISFSSDDVDDVYKTDKVKTKDLEKNIKKVVKKLSGNVKKQKDDLQKAYEDMMVFGNGAIVTSTKASLEKLY